MTKHGIWFKNCGGILAWVLKKKERNERTLCIALTVIRRYIAIGCCYLYVEDGK